jgi:hypothetical protein
MPSLGNAEGLPGVRTFSLAPIGAGNHTRAITTP